VSTLPNFLIIGAAKSGTTSLYHYLGQHPDVYLSPIKEPKYFALAGERLRYCGPGDQDDMERHSVTSEDVYRDLFRGARSGQATGEASTLYLYHQTAAGRIHAAVPSAKLVAILRHPAERAYSNFLYMVRRGNETLRDFREALAAEERRTAEGWMPSWHYRRRGLYGEQLTRYYERFQPGSIRVYLYEEFVARPRVVLQDVFAFLRVDPAFTPDLSVRHNVSGSPRIQSIHRWLSANGRAKSLVRSVMPARTARDAARRLRQWNLTRTDMPPAVRRELIEFYRDDLRALERLLARDLSSWLK
jgi:hypothetical protein